MILFWFSFVDIVKMNYALLCHYTKQCFCHCVCTFDYAVAVTVVAAVALRSMMIILEMSRNTFCLIFLEIGYYFGTWTVTDDSNVMWSRWRDWSALNKHLQIVFQQLEINLSNTSWTINYNSNIDFHSWGTIRLCNWLSVWLSNDRKK